MSKQEKIDWGLRKLIRELTNEDGTMYLLNASQKIRRYLHSQGLRLPNGEALIEETKRGQYDTGR